MQDCKIVEISQVVPAATKSIVKSDKCSRNRFFATVKAFFYKDDRGGALVEMAVTLPIVLLLMTDIFSISMALYQKLELAEAVSAGGRFLATDRGDTDPCATTAAKVYAAAPTLSSANMTFSFAITGGTTTTTYATPSCSGALMTTGGTAQIRVSYPCSLSAYGMSFAACSLSNQVAEVIQ